MRYALIFDLDGTLWDPTATSAQAWNDVISGHSMGHPGVDEKDMFRISGMRPDQFLPLIFPSMDDRSRWEIYDEIALRESELFLIRGGIMLPGVREGLERLRARFDLLIVSNCQEGYLDSFLAWSGLGPMIMDYESHGRTGFDKPRNIRMVMQRNSINDATYVGDTSSDRIAAEKAGIPFLQITHGMRPPIPGCTIFQRFSDLVDHMLRTIP